MYLCVGFLTSAVLLNNVVQTLPRTTPMAPVHKVPRELHSKTAALINYINKYYNDIHKRGNGLIQSTVGDKFQNRVGRSSGKTVPKEDKNTKSKNILSLKTIMKLLQMNYDSKKRFDKNRDTIRVHFIRNPEVLEEYKSKLRPKTRGLERSSTESIEEKINRKLRKLKDVLRRNSVNFRLSDDNLSDAMGEDVPFEVIEATTLPQSIEDEITPFKLPFEYDDLKNIELLNNSSEFKLNDDDEEFILIDPEIGQEEEPVKEMDQEGEEPGQVDQENGAWDVITKNYKWGDETASEKSSEDPNWENTKRMQSKDRWETKNEWSQKSNDNWNKKESREKNGWNKKEDDWNKKPDDWNKKVEDKTKKGNSWEQNNDWNKKTDNWNKKTDDWDKKPDDWNKKSDNWNKKTDDWNKKSNKWDEEENNWEKKKDDRIKNTDDWNKKNSWEKKDDWGKQEQESIKKSKDRDNKGNNWNRGNDWNIKDTKKNDWDRKDNSWNRETELTDRETKKTKENSWDDEKWNKKEIKNKKDDNWEEDRNKNKEWKQDKPKNDWNKKDKKNDWDEWTTKNEKNHDSWDKKNSDGDKKDSWNIKTTKHTINDWKSRKNKWVDEETGWNEKKKKSWDSDGDVETKKENTRGIESYEKEDRKGYKEKKTNEWDSFIPKTDDYGKQKKTKKRGSYERSQPAAGGHSFGRTPIPFAGKKRLYDK